ncbi:MAG: hypothetical protein ACMXX9_01950 [Candidatus Woesearchaeota archaeon]
MKKAQIQSAETIMVLIILSIIIIFGLIIASNFQRDEIPRQAQERLELSALAIASQLGNLPELRCTRRQTAVERCIDLYKAKAFAKYLEQNPSYKVERFGNTNITLHIINPSHTSDVISIATPTNENASSRTPIQIPLLVNDPLEDVYHFALLEVVTLW